MLDPVKSISLTVLFAVFVVITLVVFARSFEHPGGFRRSMVVGQFKRDRVFQADEQLVGVAGASANKIFISTDNPNVILQIDLKSKIISSVKLDFMSNEMIRSLFWVFVDFPEVYVMAGNARIFFRGNLETKHYLKDTINEYNFSSILPISGSSFICRGPDSTYQNQIIKKFNWNTGKTQYGSGLVENRNDGGISTDGTFTYDEKTKWIIYSQFYRNWVLCIDSNLHEVYSFRTIDTCAHYQVDVLNQSDTKGNISITVKSVPNYVNEASDAYDGKLYLHSKQWAENETRAVHNQQSAIDVYDLQLHKYLYSFYIPDYEGIHMRTFKVFADRILVLYNKEAILYDIK